MNSTKDYDLTIIVPVYNEEENINKLEKELSEYVCSFISKNLHTIR